MKSRLILSAIVVGLFAGCASPPPNLPSSGAIVPDEGKIQVTPSVSYTYKELLAIPIVYAALNGILDKSMDELLIFKQPILLYFVYQPFAPNWTLEEAKLTDNIYYVRLNAKRFRIGGDGEAMLMIKRRAMQLQYEHGYSGYKVLEFSEGVQSSTPIAQRYSEGVFQLVGMKAAASP